MFTMRRAPDSWQSYYELADETAAAGGRMFLQVHSRSLNAVLSFETNTPFDRLPTWRRLKKMGSLAEKEAALRDPDFRRTLIEESPRAQEPDGGRGTGPEARAADYDWLYVMDSPNPPHRSVAEVAAAQGKGPGRGVHRPGSRQGPEAVLPATAGQRGSGPRVTDD